MDIVTLGAALNGAKAYTDATIAPLLGGVHYRGSVNYFNNLPSNPAEGDAYTVKYSGTSGTSPDGTEYVWALDTDDNTYKWIGFSPDTYTKAEVDNLLSGKQPTIDNTHKLSSDLVDDSSSTNKFATAAQLSQIETNKNNISNIQQVPSVGSSDNGKVLTATYENGEGAYAWQPASGGGTTKYLYQLTVSWGCRTTSAPILGYALRFCVSFISDDENLAVTGIVDYNTFITNYIKFSQRTGYAWAVNVNSVFISDGSSGAIASIPVSTMRINWDNGHWLFRTSDGEKELEKGVSDPYVIGTKTEI